MSTGKPFHIKGLATRRRNTLQQHGVDHTTMTDDEVVEYIQANGLKRKFRNIDRAAGVVGKVKFSAPTDDVPLPPHYTQRRKKEMPSPIATLAVGQSIRLYEKCTTKIKARYRSFAKEYRKEHSLKPAQWAIKIAVDPTDKNWTRIWRVK